jgi:hypothetical protein
MNNYEQVPVHYQSVHSYYIDNIYCEIIIYQCRLTQKSYAPFMHCQHCPSLLAVLLICWSCTRISHVTHRAMELPSVKGEFVIINDKMWCFTTRFKCSYVFVKIQRTYITENNVYRICLHGVNLVVNFIAFELMMPKSEFKKCLFILSIDTVASSENTLLDLPIECFTDLLAWKHIGVKTSLTQFTSTLHMS